LNLPSGVAGLSGRCENVATSNAGDRAAKRKQFRVTEVDYRFHGLPVFAT
jgi:hypothetical protein